ncbi:MAG: DegT/DnrJ/EryC1/StrS family aminotransferase [Saprospiraceae bacterium]
MIEYESLAKVNQPYFFELREAANRVIESGWYILGKEVINFEKEFANYLNSPHCIGVANGLDAMILSLKSLNLPQGSEVIVPSNTYIATILAVIQAGCTPVLVEPDIQTYNINPSKIVEAISKDTKAILIVHLYGKMCDMDPIVQLCHQHQLYLLEDCAQSQGAKYKDQHSGTFGDFGCFSFYPTKNLGAYGDAGAVTCKDDYLALQIRRYRNYGSDIKYHNEILGHNSRLDEIQAALLIVKLKYLDQINNHKRRLAKTYHDYLKSDFILPHLDNDYFDIYHIFNIRHNKRNDLRKFLLENGIKTEIHYPIPPHQQKALLGFFEQKRFPISEEIHQTTISLPCSSSHTIDEIEHVVEVLNKF